MTERTPISEVTNEDCMVMMQRYPDKFFDLASCDPPYFKGVGKMGYFGKKSSSIGVKRGSYSIPNWDNNIPDDKWFKNVQRVSKNQIIWGANYYNFLGDGHNTPRRCDLDKWLENHPIGWIVWDKLNTASFNDFELAWTSFNKPTVVLPLIWNGMIQAKSLKEPTTPQGNKKLQEKRIHPTQKPIFLYHWQFKQYCAQGENIIDTHLGSQSSRIAAYKLGFDFWGCELDESYFKEGCARFDKAISEPLFDGIKAKYLEQKPLF